MKKFFKSLGIGILGGFIAIGATYLLYSNQNNNNSSLNSSIKPGQKNVKLVDYRIPGPETHLDFTKAAQKTVDAVVHIKTAKVKETKYYLSSPINRYFHGHPQTYEKRQPVVGIGSGVIISKDGYIVTNNHVVNNADKVEVTLNNKKIYDAKVVGTDPQTDLAVIKIDAKDLPFIDFANSEDIKVGQWVLAVGNPFNLTSTVTAGIVSAKYRNINILSSNPYTGVSPIEAYIQTDAAVNPGNSGGALVNTNGQLVGINSAIESPTGSYTGYSFAIPSNLVKKVAQDIMKYGKVQRAFLGVSIRNIDKDLADKNSLKSLKGVYILKVSPKGSAERAGLKDGDIIKEIDGKMVSNIPEMQMKLGTHSPGDKISMEVIRDGKPKEFKIKLRNFKSSFSVTNAKDENLMQQLGCKLENLSSKDSKKLEISGGVSVIKLYNGPIAQSGIQEGFIITGVNNQAISSIEDFSKKLHSADGGILISGIYPNGKHAYYGFGMPK